IELGEIESVLRQSEQISQAVVLARAGKDGKKRLISYVVGKGKYEREEVIGYLKKKLPDYMVPTLWVELESLPLTPNGKIDKKALPEPDIEKQLKDKFVAAETAEELMLTEIWQAVLKLEKIGVEDNFFDIGGHSLLAVQIITRIEQRTGKKFPLAILFEYPTIRSLSAFMQEDTTASTWRSLVPIRPGGGKVPLYVVHGMGLSVLNFNSISLHVADEQPIFGLQPKGLDGAETPLDSIFDMAKSYLEEIIEHNPSGPYAIAGYSLGGFIAFEMVRQLELMDKEVKTLIIFDTDAEYNKHNWYAILPKKIRRYSPKFIGGTKSLAKQIAKVINQMAFPFLSKKGEDAAYEHQLDMVLEKQLYALKNYKLLPIAHAISLIRAKTSVHYNNDGKYLGWQKYTEKDVKDFGVPGDHLSMLLPPNAVEFASVLQKVLDNC
ncbi:MAG: alpha/beta fold hydrolase, partial [Mucilaginibacter sp.]